MTDPITFPIDGPHSPEQTQAAGSALAEMVRYLNHATRSGEDGLEFPGDAYDLLGSLCTAMGRMPQLLDQLAAFLHAQEASGRLADARSRDAATLTAVARGALLSGRDHAGSLRRSLAKAQEQVSGLYVKEAVGE